ncbi:MAG: TetR/AcrR family transcriptional regulator [Liquorilactobacillus sp.]|uniref:TetR/AcrR family transcriptional regulator n=1 Tax=Liquorilactobacillus sp. TaxID=2767923 RepID=UPI0039ECE199
MKNTIRTLATKQKIKNTFINLIESYSFDRLTVSNITREAAISRGTFYIHYTDKFDLLSKIENEISEEFKKILEINSNDIMKWTDKDIKAAKNEPYRIFIQTLDYLGTEKKTLKVLLSKKGDPKFGLRIKEILSEQILSTMDKRNISFSDEIPADYAEEIIISGLFHIFQYWIGKSNPEPISELIKIINKSRFLAPYKMINLKGN